MKAKQTEPVIAGPIIIWESSPRKGTGQVVALPGEQKQGGVEQEPTVTIRKVGTKESPAIVTEVSSGFAQKRSAGGSAQSIRMSLAA
ncbi:hypothetical protein ACAF76_019215 [Brevibacillus sp. TJ4]|uniref:hypothetical protein n=1 Tax=Brevibacillus sp. TJ4 TaxID=3234853 RepID=UPI003B9E734E